jgi:hypothetical protein
LSEELRGLKSERKSLIFDRDYELSKGGTLGFDPEKVKKLNKQIGELDSTIDTFDAALKRKVDEHLNEIDEDEERRLRFSNAIKSFEQSQEIKSAISRGDEKYLLNQRDLAQRGMTASQQSNLPEQWEQFRGRFETYQQALEQLWAKQREVAEREVKRAEDLALARADYQDTERSRIASMKGDISYFQNMMEESKRVMNNATDANDYNAAASRVDYARGQIESIQREKISTLLNGLNTSPVSNYSALGFSMGEVMSPIGNIENQIDQIIRLMQEQMSRQIQYVNPSYTL